jgi:hypothetical protein
MLMGMIIGGAVSALLFAVTGNALSFIAAGIGLALGLILGAGVEQAREASSPGVR